MLTDRLTQQIQSGDRGALDAAMLHGGARLVELLVDPGRDALHIDTLQKLHDYFHARQIGGALPVEAFDPVDLGPLLGDLQLLDVVEGGRDFRYRVHGTRSAGRAGFDMTGKLVSEMPTRPIVRALVTAVYRTVATLRVPVAMVHRAPIEITQAYWHRLALPMVAAGGAVTRILVGLVAWPTPE